MARTKHPIPPKCDWTYDDWDGSYDTVCGNKFILNDGTPYENGFRYCCYCGKRIRTLGLDGQYTEMVDTPSPVQEAEIPESVTFSNGSIGTCRIAPRFPGLSFMYNLPNWVDTSSALQDATGAALRDFPDEHSR